MQQGSLTVLGVDVQGHRLVDSDGHQVGGRLLAQHEASRKGRVELVPVGCLEGEGAVLVGAVSVSTTYPALDAGTATFGRAAFGTAEIFMSGNPKCVVPDLLKCHKKSKAEMRGRPCIPWYLRHTMATVHGAGTGFQPSCHPSACLTGSPS